MPTVRKREPWVVHTERANEVPRRGHGPAGLYAVLKHLGERGDKTCTVDIGMGDSFRRYQGVALGERHA